MSRATPLAGFEVTPEGLVRNNNLFVSEVLELAVSNHGKYRVAGARLLNG
jgi:hypothetical protein